MIESIIAWATSLSSAGEAAGAATAVATVAGGLWRFVIRPAREFHLRVTNGLARIESELRPNGGSSLRDALDRLEKWAITQAHVNQAILETLPIGTWKSDELGRCIEATRQLSRIMGRDPEEILGMNWERWIHPDDREAVSAEWARSVETGNDFEMNYRYILPDGTIRPVHGKARTVKARDGRVLGWFGSLEVVRDPSSP